VYGYKGKGILGRLIVDAGGMPLSVLVPPANSDERKQAGPLIHVKDRKKKYLFWYANHAPLPG